MSPFLNISLVASTSSGVPQRRIFSESVLTVSSAYNQVVIRTLSGSANVAAEMLDSLGWPEVIGTLAGDNTVLLIVRSIDDVEEILFKINEMLR